MRSGLQPSTSHYQMTPTNNTFGTPYVNNGIYNHHKYQTLENTLTRQSSTRASTTNQRPRAVSTATVAPPAGTPPTAAAAAAINDLNDSLMNSQTFTTMTKLPVDTMGSVAEFPRHKLRVLEKLGEGAFGMVSCYKTYICFVFRNVYDAMMLF